MSNVKTAFLVIGGIIGFGLLSWGMIYVNGFFNAEIEGQRTKVFKESQAYTDGMRNELNGLYLQYQSANTSGRVGIAAVVRDKFASVDTNNYPQHLQTFLYEVGAR